MPSVPTAPLFRDEMRSYLSAIKSLGDLIARSFHPCKIQTRQAAFALAQQPELVPQRTWFGDFFPRPAVIDPESAQKLFALKQQLVEDCDDQAEKIRCDLRPRKQEYAVLRAQLQALAEKTTIASDKEQILFVDLHAKLVACRFEIDLARQNLATMEAILQFAKVRHGITPLSEDEFVMIAEPFRADLEIDE